jgi:hypothetical protein
MKTLNENSERKPKIKNDLPVIFDKDQVLELITWTATIDGRNINEAQMYTLVVELSNLINTRHRNLTIEEIRGAIRRGVAGDYGDYYGLGLKSFNHWITSYKAAKFRKEEKQRIKDSMSIAERAEFIKKGLKKR